jgi:hypothetical protein
MGVENLKPVDLHAVAVHNALARMSVYLRDPGEWTTALTWLSLGAGLTSVRYELPDEWAGYCGAAADHDTSQEELRQRFALQLARFSFVWSGFESVASIIKPPQPVVGNKIQPGKVTAACYFLLNHFGPTGCIVHYEDVIAEFRKKILGDSHYGALLGFLQPTSLVGVSGVGLRAVYKIRNSLAHAGSNLRFPEPDGFASADDDCDVDERGFFVPRKDFEIIDLASSLLLMSIQMLVVAYQSKTGLSEDDDGELVSLEIAHVQHTRKTSQRAAQSRTKLSEPIPTPHGTHRASGGTCQRE